MGFVASLVLHSSTSWSSNTPSQANGLFPNVWNSVYAFGCVCIGRQGAVCWGVFRWGGGDKKVIAWGKSRTIVLLLYTVLIAIFSYMHRDMPSNNFLASTARRFVLLFLFATDFVVGSTFSCQQRILFKQKKNEKSETIFALVNAIFRFNKMEIVGKSWGYHGRSNET